MVPSLLALAANCGIRFRRFLNRAAKVIFSAGLVLQLAGAVDGQNAATPGVAAPQAAPPNLPGEPLARITEAVDTKKLLRLTGNTHPLARPEFDRGPVASAEPMTRMLLVLQRSQAQEAGLRQFLDEQQSKTSSNFQNWLTPAQFGEHFGPADADIQTVTQWLEAQGFSVDRVADSRMVIEFSGTAGQVQTAFHTAIHHFVVGGTEHVANADDPQIPAALAPVVAGVVSLHNFGRKSHARYLGEFRRDIKTGKTTPLVTLPFGNNFYGVGPADFAKIYNTQPLWDAGIDGTGQTIAVVGETNIDIADVEAFRNVFGLPINDPQIILNGANPGVTSIDEESEADLDVQWTGAVAKNATIKFVVSASTPASAGVDLSALYIIEHNLAPVMSESYGECEQNLLTAGNQYYKTLWQQAAAQGITVVLSSGDGGSAGCDDFNNQKTATQGLAVSGFASTPYNVSVGGTDFDDVNNWSAYWSDSNDPATQISALSYIPEIPWNQTCAQLGITKCAGTVPDGFDSIIAASGGPSTIYSKPSWQLGVTGMPNDNHRDQPDISLFASPGFDGSGYIYCQKDLNGSPDSCLVNTVYFNFHAIGGTSASAPAFAGIMALVNQYQSSHGGNSRQGNANFTLYALAKKVGSTCPSVGNPATTCVFYDVSGKGNSVASGTVGTNSVPCDGGSLNCSSSVHGTDGVLVDPAKTTTEAWTGGAGYDMASGLGSINANNLATNWGSVSTIGTTTTLSLNPTSGITHGTSENVKVSSTVVQATGSSKPTGSISLIATMTDGSTLGLDTFTLNNGAVNNQKAHSLPGGTYKISAHYAGDGTNAPSDSAPIDVTVGKEDSQTFIVIPTFDPSGNPTSGNATSLPYGSSYIIRMYVTDKNGSSNPSGAPGSTCDSENILTCPTGSVILAASGDPLDGGVFSLNNAGYTRDIIPSLTGGSYSLIAKYFGDNSYNRSTSDTTTLTITPADMQISTVGISGSEAVGSSINMSATATSTVVGGVTPTGTFQFFDNGNLLPGTVAVTSTPGGTGFNGQISGMLTAPINSSGQHAITAQYSGDANYKPITSPVNSIPFYYATTTTQSVDFSTINLGQSVTVTAIAKATVKNPTLTGQFQFNASGTPIPGNVGGTLSTDAGGNQVLTASVVTTPQSSETISAVYLGDNNFAESSSITSVTVNIPDFSVNSSSSSLVVTATQAGTQQFNIVPTSNMSSTVALSCAGNPPGTACSIQPPAVNLANGVATPFTLTLSPAPGANAVRAKNFIVKHAGFLPWDLSLRWSLTLLSAAAILFLIGWPGRRRRLRSALGLGMTCLIASIIGCGGGSGGGGTPPPPVGPFATATVVSTSNADVAAAAPLTFTAKVTSAGTPVPTGNVDFFMNGVLYGTSLLSAGTATLQNVVSSSGIYSVTAQYKGDTNSNPSTSSGAQQTIAGTTIMFINAQTGTITHQIPVNVMIQ